MAVKLNNYDNYESIKVTLSKGEYPIAYNNKIEELVEEGALKYEIMSADGYKHLVDTKETIEDYQWFTE